MIGLFAKTMDQFGKLIHMGVRLVGGSDCGWSSYPFGDFQGELLAMADAGLSPIQAICAGTHDCATALRISGRVGTIEPGKEADLLLVNGDPTQDLEALRRVAAVFKSGRRLDIPEPQF